MGFFSNDQTSSVQSYLRDAAGNPTFGGQAAGGNFAAGNFNLDQQNLANALSLKTDTKGNFDWDIALTRYDYLQDIQRSPFAVTPTGLGFTDTGRIARFDAEQQARHVA